MSLLYYANRSVDLLFLAGDLREGYQTELQSNMLQKNGQFVAGPQKLMQRVLLTLLTTQGSMPLSPTLGTTFLLPDNVLGWQTTNDISQSFYLAHQELMQGVQAMEQADDPDDERLATVELQGVTIQNGTATLFLTMTTVAGSNVEFQAPVAVTTFR